MKREITPELFRTTYGMARRLSRSGAPPNLTDLLAEARNHQTPRGFAGARDRAVRAAHIVVLTRAARPIRPLRERADGMVLARHVAEIARRGGETRIEGRDENSLLRFLARDRARGLDLVGVDGWRQYSRRFGARRASLRYLCGTDDNGPWAARVAGTCDTIEAALAYLTPAEVRWAEREGRQVLRQGDIWLVEARRDNLRALPRNHRWDAGRRVIAHEPRRPGEAAHREVHCPWPVRAVPQSALGMGRGWGRGAAD